MKSRHSYQRHGYPPQRASRTPSPIQSGPFNPPASGQDWELAINGDLTDKQHELISSLVDAPRRSRGIIWFDSGGGSVYVGLALCSIIRLRGLRVTGVVAGECSSAAILPFAACERRFVTPHSTLLFHPMRWQSADEVKLEEATEWARHFKNLEGDLDKLLAKLFEFPADKIAEWTNPGRFITGPELVDAGLARIVDMFDGDLWSQMSRQ
jgi:ATP-dependent Clp protease, protease subunit